jgi:hypothetical protein
VTPGDGDRPTYLDREKLSYAERDRLRRERRSSGDAPPRSPAARARVEAANKLYLKEIDHLFAPAGEGGAEGRRLAEVMRDAHGSPGLADACRAYRAAVGVPSERPLLALFLDSGVVELVIDALAGLRTLSDAGSLEVSAGLKSQLRMLVDDADADVAEGAEELLERF